MSLGRRLVAFSWMFVLVFSGCGGGPIEVDGGLTEGAPVPGDPTIVAYKGIPFASPPVGDLRWKPPQPVVPWAGVRRTTEFGFVCPQLPYPEDSFWARLQQWSSSEMSEDCLYLNVWAPAETPREKLPVMVWIHGGALTRGSGTRAHYDGTALVRRGVVLVTINYRLAAFGFLAHPELTAESEHGSSGNFGILDQIAALEWVQRNIATFGGDPDRVTIFGESAGSSSVSYLMATPLAEGLFHRAIGQSGGAFRPMPRLDEELNGRPAPVVTGQTFAAELVERDDVSLAAMRQASTQDVLDAYSRLSGRAYRIGGGKVDGWVFPEDVHTTFSEGRQHDVPVLLGSNADEGPPLYQRWVPKDSAGYAEYVETTYGEFADEFLELWPNGDAEVIWNSYLKSRGQVSVAWTMTTWARLMTTVSSKAWLYHFSHVPPIPDAEIFGAYHAGENFFVFDNLHLGGYTEVREVDKMVANLMASYWVNFARDGDPDGEGLPEWGAYEPGDEAYMELAAEPKAGNHLLAAEIDFFDSFYAAQRGER